MTAPLPSLPPAVLPRLTRAGAALTREIEVLDEYGSGASSTSRTSAR